VNGYCITMGVWLPYSKRLWFKNAKVLRWVVLTMGSSHDQ
jgi:hypothetical protein